MIIIRLRMRLMQWLGKEQGSFSLESALVFPLLLATILLFIIFGMYMYQKVVLYYAASSTAERAAFIWDNSNRDPRSGLLIEPKYDGLYWRIREDEMLKSVFGLTGNEASTMVALPAVRASGADHGTLSQIKLGHSAQWITHAGLSYEGEINYWPSVFKKSVEVKLKQPLSMAAIEQNLWKRKSAAASTAVIVDPTEFIRSVDLLRYYTSRLKSNAGEEKQLKEEAGKALAPYQGAE